MKSKYWLIVVIILSMLQANITGSICELIAFTNKYRLQVKNLHNAAYYNSQIYYQILAHKTTCNIHLSKMHDAQIQYIDVHNMHVK